MRHNLRGCLDAIAAFCILSLAAAVGCGARQDTTETAETGTAAAPSDYRGRLDAALRADGIDLSKTTCNTNVIWADRMGDDADAFASDLETTVSPHLKRVHDADRDALNQQIGDLAMNWFIRVLLIHGNFNNLGAVVLSSKTWTDEAGHTHPLVVFHSSTTPFAADEGSCFRSLLREGRIRHVINLYDGDVPLRDQIEAEARVAEELGVDYVDLSQLDHGYGNWREIAGDVSATDEQREAAAQGVARLIRERILAPGGAPPRGNVYFHCAGGMHRSPLLAGVLRRCLTDDSMEQVEEAMRIHTAFVDAAHPGGFEGPMVELVRRFDCDLLEQGAGGVAPPSETAGEAGEGAAAQEAPPSPTE
jgi:hypothetical protein